MGVFVEGRYEQPTAGISQNSVNQKKVDSLEELIDRLFGEGAYVWSMSRALTNYSDVDPKDVKLK